MKPLQVLKELIESSQVSLAWWLAAPLDPDQARQGLSGVQQRLRGARGDADERFRLALAEMIYRYWAGQDIDVLYLNLAALLSDIRQSALLELCYGQLLIARRCLPAWQHLDRGFQLAAHLLEPEDYFGVLRRHTLLRHLPLSSQPAVPASLDTLLNEARVIARLTGHRRPAGSGDHRDTLD